MFDPNAAEFKPRSELLNPQAASFTPLPKPASNTDTKDPSSSQQRGKKKTSRDGKAKSGAAQQQQQQQQQLQKGSSTHKKQTSPPRTPQQRKASSSVRASSKQSSQPQQKQLKQEQKQKQKKTSLFDEPVKFITLEQPIEPVYRIRPEDPDEGELRLSHGYERYIEWIGRCLKTFEAVTLVGMDGAIVDVVSLVNILQERYIGEHEDVETFTVEQGNKRHISCLQVRLCRT